MEWSDLLGKDWYFPVARIIVLLVATVGFGFLDFALYNILLTAKEYGTLRIDETGTSKLTIDIRGTGPIAEAVREVLQYDYSKLIEKKYDTSVCYDKSPYSYSTMALIFPLVLLLLMAVFFVGCNLLAPKVKRCIKTRV